MLAALGQRRDCALPAVLAAAQSGDAAVRAAALRALGALGDAGAVPLLMKNLAGGDERLAVVRPEALSAIDSPAVACAVIAALSTPTAALCPGCSSWPRSNGWPRPGRSSCALDDPDPAVRLAAAKALGQTARAEDIARLLDRVAKGGEGAAAVQDALRATFDRLVDKEACVKGLVAAGRPSSPALYGFAVELLGVAGGPTAAAFVAEAAASADETVRENGLSRVGRMAGPGGRSDAVALGQDQCRRQAACPGPAGYIRIIRQFGDVAAHRLEMVKEALAAAERDEERLLAVESLGRIASPEALAMVLGFVDRPLYRETACAAAVQVAEELLPTHPQLVADAMARIGPRIENPKLAIRADSAVQKRPASGCLKGSGKRALVPQCACYFPGCERFCGWKAATSRRSPKGLLRRPAVHLDFDVVVQVVGGVALGVQPHVSALGRLALLVAGVHELAAEVLDVLQVLAHAQARGIVEVVVEDRLHVLDEVGVVGHLDHDVVIHAGLAVIVPHDDGVDLGRAPRSICTHCLSGPSSTKLPSEPSLSPSVIMRQLADDRLRVAGGDLLLQGQVRGARRGVQGGRALSTYFSSVGAA